MVCKDGGCHRVPIRTILSGCTLASQNCRVIVNINFNVKATTHTHTHGINVIFFCVIQSHVLMISSFPF